jgi:hypothetical protein
MSSSLEETISAVRDELGETADPLFVRQLAQACHQTIGYFAAPGDGFPEGHVATCLMLEHELRVSRGEVV